MKEHQEKMNKHQPTVHCCKRGWKYYFQADEQHGILLTLFNGTAANATPDSNASTLAANHNDTP